jgi:hypothetical protein
MVSCSFCLVFKYRSLWTLNTAVIADAYFCGVSILGTLQVPCGRASATGNTILYPTLLIPKTVVALFHFRWWMLLLKRCCCCEYKLLFEPGYLKLTFDSICLWMQRRNVHSVLEDRWVSFDILEMGTESVRCFAQFEPFLGIVEKHFLTFYFSKGSVVPSSIILSPKCRTYHHEIMLSSDAQFCHVV